MRPRRTCRRSQRQIQISPVLRSGSTASAGSGAADPLHESPIEMSIVVRPFVPDALEPPLTSRFAAPAGGGPTSAAMEARGTLCGHTCPLVVVSLSPHRRWTPRSGQLGSPANVPEICRISRTGPTAPRAATPRETFSYWEARTDPGILLTPPGATWFRRGSRNRRGMSRSSHLVNPSATYIVANDDNYALAA